MGETQRHSPTPQFTVHDRLRKSREVAGLEQTELAERIEVDRGTISNYETGKVKRLKPPVLKRWALACEVDIDWLIHGTESDDGPGGLEVSRRGCNGGEVIAFRARQVRPAAPAQKAA